jgi:hypothetical protein
VHIEVVCHPSQVDPPVHVDELPGQLRTLSRICAAAPQPVPSQRYSFW